MLVLNKSRHGLKWSVEGFPLLPLSVFEKQCPLCIPLLVSTLVESAFFLISPLVPCPHAIISTILLHSYSICCIFTTLFSHGSTILLSRPPVFLISSTQSHPLLTCLPLYFTAKVYFLLIHSCLLFKNLKILSVWI